MPYQTSLDIRISHLQLIRVPAASLPHFGCFGWLSISVRFHAKSSLSCTKSDLARYRPPLRQHIIRATVLDLFANLLRIALWFAGAGWFYRCGPRIQRFFSPETSGSHIAPASNPEPTTLEP